MFILTIKNKYYIFKVGTDKRKLAEEWKQLIFQVRDEDQLILDFIKDRSKIESRLVQKIGDLKQFNLNVKDVHLDLLDSNNQIWLTLNATQFTFQLGLCSCFIEIILSLEQIEIQQFLKEYLDPSLKYLLTQKENEAGIFQMRILLAERAWENYQNTDLQLKITLGQIFANFHLDVIAFFLQFITSHQDSQEIEQEQQIQPENNDTVIVPKNESQTILILIGIDISQITCFLGTYQIIQFVSSRSHRFKIRTDQYQGIQSSDLNLLTADLDLIQIQKNLIIGSFELPRNVKLISRLPKYQRTRTHWIQRQGRKQGQVHDDVAIEDSNISLASRQKFKKKTIDNLLVSKQTLTNQSLPIFRKLHFDFSTSLSIRSKKRSLNFKGTIMTNLKSNPKIVRELQVQLIGKRSVLEKYQNKIDPLAGQSISQIKQELSSPSLVQLKITINNPLIKIPTMRNQFIIDLGQVTLKNYIGKISDKVFRENYEISAEGASISLDYNDEEHSISEFFDVFLLFKRPILGPQYAYMGILIDESLNLELKITPIIAKIGKLEIKAIYEMIFNNLAYDDFYDDYLQYLNKNQIDLSQQFDQDIYEVKEQSMIKQKQEKEKKINELFLDLQLSISQIGLYIIDETQQPISFLSLKDNSLSFQLYNNSKKKFQLVFNQVDGVALQRGNQDEILLFPFVGKNFNDQTISLDEQKMLYKFDRFSEQQNQNKVQINIEIKPFTQRMNQMVVDLICNDLTLTLHSEQILQILAITKPPYIDQLKPKYEDYFQDQNLKENIMKENQKGNLLFSSKIDLQKLLIVIATNFENESQFTCFKGGFYIVYNSYLSIQQKQQEQILAQGTINLLDFESFICRKSELIKLVSQDLSLIYKRCLIYPTRLLFNFKQFLKVQEQTKLIWNYQSEISKVQLKIALSDFQQFQKDARCIAWLLAEITNIYQSPQVDEEYLNLSKLKSDATQEIQLDFRAEGIEITGVNDVGENFQHILAIELSQFEIKMYKNRIVFYVKTLIPLQISYYNFPIGIWEPVIEKTIFTIDYIVDLKGQNPKGKNQLIIEQS